MTEVTLTPAGAVALDGPAPVRPRLDSGFDGRSTILFCGLLAFGLFFIAYSVYEDVRTSGTQTTTWLPFVLLGVALLIALGFEFVNGFHDTANAVATVIYTHSLSARVAVVELISPQSLFPDHIHGIRAWLIRGSVRPTSFFDAGDSWLCRFSKCGVTSALSATAVNMFATGTLAANR